jgi:AraC family transcriptional activator of pobA
MAGQDQVHKPCIISLEYFPDEKDAIWAFYYSMLNELRVPMINQTAMCASLFISMFVHLSRITEPGLADQQMDNSSRKASQINKFLAIVDQKFRQRLTVNDYSCEMGMSPGHLSRLCRLTLGMSSLDVINMRVIQEAQRELVIPQRPSNNWLPFWDLTMRPILPVSFISIRA